MRKHLSEKLEEMRKLLKKMFEIASGDFQDFPMFNPIQIYQRNFQIFIQRNFQLFSP